MRDLDLTETVKKYDAQIGIYLKTDIKILYCLIGLVPCRVHHPFDVYVKMPVLKCNLKVLAYTVGPRALTSMEYVLSLKEYRV